ncbi:MAG: hypothetical protein ACJ77K_17405 [Bacteroidia bacterium]
MTLRNTFRMMLLCSLFFFSGITLKAQTTKEVKDQTYVVLDKGSVSDVQPYIDAMNNSDMRYHRLRNTRSTIVFETGVKIELFSASEMIASGRTLNLTDYPESFGASRDMPAFSLGPNNIIMEMHHVNFKHK